MKMKHMRIGVDQENGEIFIYRQMPNNPGEAREKKEATNDAACAVVRHIRHNDPEEKGGELVVIVDGDKFAISLRRIV